MDRRKFLKNSVFGSLALGSTIHNYGCETSDLKKITILHTNDVHSHIEPFSSEHSEFPNQGGFERRSTLVNSIRNNNPNTLLFDAGDIFQGTPYFNFFNGELEFKLMSLLKYDAVTIGNHDFDNGISGLYEQMPKASFDFLISNYDFSNTILDGKTKKYKIYNKSGIKIGVFGLGIELEGLVTKELYKETKYLDPIEISRDISNRLKFEENCDLIICLSHLGYRYDNLAERICDYNLAKKSNHIDLIIGGHTHTFMDKPIVLKNEKGNDVIINQVGCFGLYLGQIDFFFDRNNKRSFRSSVLKI